ncbi:MAG: energy-coupling factor ABC transporter ATP-binding protein [Coprobacillus sp.]
MIKIRQMNVVYDQVIQALEDINLHLDNQKCIGIVGQNGSGKSTLLSSLVNLVEHTGDIEVDDLSLNKKTVTTFRQKIGLVFQNPDHMLFLPSVKDNLSFGLINQGCLNDEIEQRIKEISEIFCIEDFLDRNANHLSGGQKRIVSLASVVIMKPEILLLDEPSAFLDPKSRRNVMNIIKDLDQQIIFSTHDLDMALDLCDEIVLLNNGKVVKVGKTQDILTDEQLLLDNGLELPYRYQR